jgi:hypothetical protein
VSKLVIAIILGVLTSIIATVIITNYGNMFGLQDPAALITEYERQRQAGDQRRDESLRRRLFFEHRAVTCDRTWEACALFHQVPSSSEYDLDCRSSSDPFQRQMLARCKYVASDDNISCVGSLLTTITGDDIAIAQQLAEGNGSFNSARDIVQRYCPQCLTCTPG